jgi:hypothetical protein
MTSRGRRLAVCAGVLVAHLRENVAAATLHLTDDAFAALSVVARA